ncbi:ribosome maturation factor RimM [Devosia sp. SL43]|uniref:ribosome maturation factor RimM n=1 Tax=Devosia sp. SL43 TaxID=2806348 RepID=UPI001EED079F|nr:ribosome maturation factor RimM [Devosia sp. SL43]UJW84315.1 ribosome maturation factor RimM [Devosia sp. SL43]
MTAKTNRILLGQIGAAHGIKGEVRIATHTQDPLAIGRYGPLDTDTPGVTITLSKMRVQKNVVVAHIKGVTDRTAAEKLNGTNLYLDRSKLPETDDEDDFYHADLLGLEARLESGVVLGTVSAIPNFGAGDLIEIRDPQSGDTYLYPFTKAVVPHVHIADGFLTIVVPLDVEEGDEEPN